MSLSRSDVIIVGAGPAGCAAALHLAAQGYAVTLVERLSLPQVKACGDLLLPDAVRALGRFGLEEALLAAGMSLAGVSLTAASGAELELNVPTLALKRPVLHALLYERLRALGVVVQRGEILEPLRAASGELLGVRCRQEGEIVELLAPLVILASGARPETLQRFGLCLRSTPTAVAIRAYYRDYDHPGDTILRLACHPSLAPGFFWVCPLPEQQYSIGCGHFLSPGEAPEQLYLQNRLEFLMRTFPPACRIVGQEDMVGTPCSSLLRTGLDGSRLHDDGLLVIGEAAGSSSPLFGAGVGKALESGELAGVVASAALAARRFDASFLARYPEELLARYGELYCSQRKARQWLSSPRELNTLIRKAGKDPQLRKRLEGVLNADLPPTAAVSFWTFFLP